MSNYFAIQPSLSYNNCSFIFVRSSFFDSNASAMKGFLTLLLVELVNAKTFKVFHNTFDPAVFGTTGGAHHNATGDGYVDALSICIRFQVIFALL